MMVKANKVGVNSNLHSDIEEHGKGFRKKKHLFNSEMYIPAAENNIEIEESELIQCSNSTKVIKPYPILNVSTYDQLQHSLNPVKKLKTNRLPIISTSNSPKELLNSSEDDRFEIIKDILDSTSAVETFQHVSVAVKCPFEKSGSKIVHRCSCSDSEGASISTISNSLCEISGKH